MSVMRLVTRVCCEGTRPAPRCDCMTQRLLVQRCPRISAASSDGCEFCRAQTEFPVPTSSHPFHTQLPGCHTVAPDPPKHGIVASVPLPASRPRGSQLSGQQQQWQQGSMETSNSLSAPQTFRLITALAKDQRKTTQTRSNNDTLQLWPG